jgi:LysR family hca operon transcriptional activator
MELRHLKYFVAVAEELSFTRAAERLRTAQPSLSQQIKDLETHVGVSLLLRTKRNVALTEAGRVFLDEARLVLAQAQRAVTQAQKVGQQDVRRLIIGFVPAAEVKIFPNLLTAILAELANANLIFRNLTTFEQHDGLLNDNIDIAFMRHPVDDRRLTGEVVLKERLVAAIPSNHPLCQQPKVSLHDLSSLPYVCVSLIHAGNLHSVIKDFLREHSIQAKVVQEVENVMTCLSLVSMGVGYAFLPDYADQLSFKNVTTRPLIETSPELDLLMVWRANDISPELSVFRELVRDSLGLTRL